MFGQLCVKIGASSVWERIGNKMKWQKDKSTVKLICHKHNYRYIISASCNVNISLWNSRNCFPFTVFFPSSQFSICVWCIRQSLFLRLGGWGAINLVKSKDGVIQHKLNFLLISDIVRGSNIQEAYLWARSPTLCLCVYPLYSDVYTST